MDIKLLYQDIIMEHSRNPKNKGFLEGDNYIVTKMHNPSCGDKIEIQIGVSGNKVSSLRHSGAGCTICCASASILCQDLQDKTVEEVQESIVNFRKMLTNEPFDTKSLSLEQQALAGVSQFPARIKCAMLPYQAIELFTKKEEK